MFVLKWALRLYLTLENVFEAFPMNWTPTRLVTLFAADAIIYIYIAGVDNACNVEIPSTHSVYKHNVFFRASTKMTNSRLNGRSWHHAQEIRREHQRGLWWRVYFVQTGLWYLHRGRPARIHNILGRVVVGPEYRSCMLPYKHLRSFTARLCWSPRYAKGMVKVFLAQLMN